MKLSEPEMGGWRGGGKGVEGGRQEFKFYLKSSDQSFLASRWGLQGGPPPPRGRQSRAPPFSETP